MKLSLSSTEHKKKTEMVSGMWKRKLEVQSTKSNIQIIKEEPRESGGEEVIKALSWATRVSIPGGS